MGPHQIQVQVPNPSLTQTKLGPNLISRCDCSCKRACTRVEGTVEGSSSGRNSGGEQVRSSSMPPWARGCGSGWWRRGGEDELYHDFRVIELLKKIIRDVKRQKDNGVIQKDDVENLDEEELKGKLCSLLMNQGRYLIVLDDVWRKEVWERISTAFPDTRNGSRVIFTTRHIDVAKSADPAVSPYALRLLDETKCVKLFLQKVYPHQNVQTFPKDLEDVGRELVNKCRGLPLALVVLGGLLSVREKNRREWSRVLSSSNWQFAEGKECLTVLALSYEDLSHELKPCFLYVGAFPEDSIISASRLIGMWMAQGFTPQMWPKTRGERARDFLHELVQRCMVQEAEKEYDGSIKSIRIHDLLRDLCLDEAKEGFLVVRNNQSDDRSTFSDVMTARCLPLHDYNDIRHISSSTEHTRYRKLHTLLGFNFRGEYEMICRTIGQALHGLKLLRVMDMEIVFQTHSKDKMLPEEIKMMSHLRYLRWINRLAESVMLPSVANLRSLQTLHVQGLTVDSNGGIGDLKDLQELPYIRAGNWMKKDLEKLTNLQRLDIYDIKPSQEEDLVRSLKKLDNLESLWLGGELIPAELPSILSNDYQLRVLGMDGRFSRTDQLLSSSEFPPNLTKLTLSFCGLQQDPMTVLENLPNLVYLRLERAAYVGRAMFCSGGGFPRLQRMVLLALRDLEYWRVEFGAMPGLTHLTIDACWKLAVLPEGLEHITTLQELQLLSTEGELKERLRENEGVDWYKVQHIPSIMLT